MRLKRVMTGLPRQAAMAALAPVERSLLARANALLPAAARAVFIVGPPRSGTTLLYELLVTRFRFAYFSNAAHRLYRTPVAATRLFRRLIADWRGSFESEQGRIRGWGAPCEAGWIWDRWLPGEEALDAADVEAMPVDVLRRTVGAVSRIIDAPFLSKNVNHSVRVGALDAIFPGCLFIEIRRDDVDTVRSIYRLRLSRHGPGRVREWMSVKPRDWIRARDVEPIEQIAKQVRGVRADIEDDAERLGAPRRLTISYEGLCRDPRGELERIGQFLRTHDVRLRQRHEVPKTFERSASSPLDDALERRIEAMLGKGTSEPRVPSTDRREPMRVAA